MGQAQQPQHDDRYAQAEEYMKVMYKLFQSSWRDDAVQLDRKNGIYTSPDLVRQINHRGKFFNVPGPRKHHSSPAPDPYLSCFWNILEYNTLGSIAGLTSHLDIVQPSPRKRHSSPFMVASLSCFGVFQSPYFGTHGR